MELPMSWETHQGRRYYYHKFKVNGKVMSVYMGTCPVVDLFAQRVEDRRIESAIEKENRQAHWDRLDAQERPILDYFSQVEAQFHVAMKAAGWYQHRRQWRKRGLITMGKRHQIASLNFTPDADIETAMYRRLFADDEDGTLVDANGADMARNAENALISQITNDPRQREALRRKLVLIKDEQAGPNPTAIEGLLARRVALCWLDAYYMDMLSSLTIGSGAVDSNLSDYYQRRQSRAHRRFLSASKALAVCRRLALPSVQSTAVSIDPRLFGIISGSSQSSHVDFSNPVTMSHAKKVRES
jgi:hypothetical protein